MLFVDARELYRLASLIHDQTMRSGRAVLSRPAAGACIEALQSVARAMLGQPEHTLESELGSGLFEVAEWDQETGRNRFKNHAICEDFDCAVACFDIAVKKYPDRRITMRQGARVIKKHNLDED